MVSKLVSNVGRLLTEISVAPNTGDIRLEESTFKKKRLLQTISKQTQETVIYADGEAKKLWDVIILLVLEIVVRNGVGCVGQSTQTFGHKGILRTREHVKIMHSAANCV